MLRVIKRKWGLKNISLDLSEIDDIVQQGNLEMEMVNNPISYNGTS